MNQTSSQSLPFQIPGVDAQIRPEEREAFAVAGKAWLESVVAAVRLAYPGQAVQLRTKVQDTEPMGNFNDVKGFIPPAEQSCSTLLIDGADSREPLVRMLNLPGEHLADQGYQYTFIRRTTTLRKIIAKTWEIAHRTDPIMLDAAMQRLYRRQRDIPIVPVGKLHQTLTDTGKGGKPTVWVAMHWLENGGAEAWSLEQIRIARKAGWEIIVTVDRCSPQRIFDQVAKLADHVYLAAHALGNEDWGQFAANLIARHQITRLHIHHSLMAYMLLPEIREQHPQLEIFDSTHIVEYRGGGFPKYAALYSDYIDTHHVISPQLAEYLRSEGVAQDKIAYHPLTNFTAQMAAKSALPATPKQPLRIGFLGRMAMQKRPFLFVEMVRQLHRAHPGLMHYVMQGSGELETAISRQLQRAGLEDVIEWRPWGAVDEFFKDIDVLVVCSENEGLTLTALEADANNVLVVSANVGSQRTITLPQLLLPAMPHAFLRATRLVLPTLGQRPDLVIDLLKSQREQIAQLRSMHNAAEFTTRCYEKDQA